MLIFFKVTGIPVSPFQAFFFYVLGNYVSGWWANRIAWLCMWERDLLLLLGGKRSAFAARVGERSFLIALARCPCEGCHLSKLVEFNLSTEQSDLTL